MAEEIKEHQWQGWLAPHCKRCKQPAPMALRIAIEENWFDVDHGQWRDEKVKAHVAAQAGPCRVQKRKQNDW